eukprot:TRINITY_DN5368_c0_g2_i1.p1 TRINITY_DN5368_c0_g2~~TRINITY_DN5368_c0_g2_i1.p1  ORF type:complete len:398 (-),score=62.56 TRINITY_DN5368_c0_g2_i1:670-1863(-)
MEVLGTILDDWSACSPEGHSCASLPPGSFRVVIAHAAAVANATASSGSDEAQQDALSLFNVVGSGLPPFMRLLRVSGDRESIHFLYFWHAFSELRRRLGRLGEDNEPIAEELEEFRDGLLRSKRLTLTSLVLHVKTALRQSTDAQAWVSIRRSFERAVHVDGKRHLRSEQALDLLWDWLRGLVDDYLNGNRHDLIRRVRDVTGCSRRIACLCLGLHGTGNAWDIEVALLRFYSSGQGSMSTSDKQARNCRRRELSWSSHGVKLRRQEIECPICMREYAKGAVKKNGSIVSALSTVQTCCCFQVVCEDCRGRLVDPEGVFSCPFCRQLGPLPPVLPDGNDVTTSGAASKRGRQRRASSLGGIARKATHLLQNTGRAVGQAASAFLEFDRPLRPRVERW